MAEPIARLPFLIGEAAMQGEMRTQELLTKLALLVERNAKVHAGEGGSHKYGTKTTATPGSGPAVISGELRRSLTHQKIPEGYKVGTASVPHSRYHRSNSGKYRKSRFGSTSDTATIGKALETGLRNGATYPFLGPAFDEVRDMVDETAKVTFEKPFWT